MFARFLVVGAVVGLLSGCSDDALHEAAGTVPEGAQDSVTEIDDNGPVENVDGDGESSPGQVLSPTGGVGSRVVDPDPTRVRVVAANITSGRDQSYDTGEGTRIFQGIKPDIALVQEMNFGENADQDLRDFVDEAFGPDYYVFRETGAQIPNAIVSRYPILASGQWSDSQVSNRDYAWARLDIPGDRELFAVSVHFSASSGALRNAQAKQLASFLDKNLGNDFLVIGGDFNTGGGQPLANLARHVDTKAPQPVDQKGNKNTNRGRKTVLDWVLADPTLMGLEIPVEIGSQSFDTGLVFDSRVYSPLSDVAPVKQSDSNAMNMQHMAVIRDFNFATLGNAATVQQ